MVSVIDLYGSLPRLMMIKVLKIETEQLMNVAAGSKTLNTITQMERIYYEDSDYLMNERVKPKFEISERAASFFKYFKEMFFTESSIEFSHQSKHRVQLNVEFENEIQAPFSTSEEYESFVSRIND